MAKSAGEAGLTVNGTVKEMMELQQKGGLISSKVLPVFAKNMSAAAKANGGLEKAMLSNRVAMNRMMFAIQEGADIMFKSGLSAGLTEFFNTSASSIVELKPLWESLGKILGSVFHTLSKLVKAVTPTLVSLGEVLKSITTGLGETYSWLLLTTTASSTLYGIMSKMGGLKVFTARVFPWVAGLMAALEVIEKIAFWAEEIDNLLFSRNKKGVLFDASTGSTDLGGFAGDIFKESWFGKFFDMFTATGGQEDRYNQNFKNTMDYFMGKPPTVVVEVTADAQQMGIGVAQSSAITQTIDGRLQQTQQ